VSIDERLSFLERIHREVPQLKDMYDYKLEAFARRLKMVMTTVFGEDSGYLKELDDIGLHSYPQEESQVTVSRGGVEEQVSVYQVMQGKLESLFDLIFLDLDIQNYKERQQG
jgi:hypothetical protein